MATERQSPGALIASSGLTGVVADIQDDPDSPDASWLVATGNNISIGAQVSFPTPTGDPTVGADLQEFKAWVRQYDEGQTGTPDVRIELWENNALVRAGSDEPVTTGGHMVTFTWNASELATADGSLVECKVVGTKTGGSPSTRNTVDIGAIEWNVEYSAGVVVTPGTLAHTTTSYIPTIAVSDNQVVTPSVLAHTITLYIPTVTASDHQTVIPDTVTLNITLYIPIVSVGADVVVIPNTLSLLTSAFIPTIAITQNQKVIPNTLVHTLVEYIPVIAISDNQIVTPDALALTIAYFVPTVAVGGDVIVTPEMLALPIAMFAPTITIPSGTVAVLKIWTGNDWGTVG